MEKEPAFIGCRFGPGVDGPDDELPLAGVNGTLDDDGVPQLPAVTGRQGPAHRRAPAVLEKGQLLVLGDDVFGVDVEVAADVHGKLRKEVPLVNVVAAEPAAVRHPGNAGNGLDLGQISHGQGKDQGDGVPAHQAGRRGGVHPGIPSRHHGAEKRKGQHRHRHAADGEPGP